MNAYDFDPAKLRTARTAARISVARIGHEVGVSAQTVTRYLAGTRAPELQLLPRLAEAVGVAPADLCTVEHERLRLIHLRAFTGRSGAEMAHVLGIAEETYRRWETTGRHGLRPHYDADRDEWIEWEDRAAPAFATTPKRLRAAQLHTEAYWPLLQELRWQRTREARPEWAAMVETIAENAPGRPSH
ncbi:helix-turn-helix domain-containing protein [Kitasatospora sp. NPDC057541]|uniref:helix-turn-helix domain-containing protein n=1 Tax=unclassified Kitasatospora TaxID=2633591 RepID=UPI00368E6D5B